MNRTTELATRPSLEEAVAGYEALLIEIRDRLDTEVGPLDWAITRPAGGSGCGTDFPDLGGNSVTTPLWTAPGGIPDQRWPQAVQILTRLAGQRGFGPADTVVDRPGDHEIAAYDPYGAYLILGTKANAVIQIGTGCHLTAAKKREAVPG